MKTLIRLCSACLKPRRQLFWGFLSYIRQQTVCLSPRPQLFWRFLSYIRLRQACLRPRRRLIWCFLPYIRLRQDCLNPRRQLFRALLSYIRLRPASLSPRRLINGPHTQPDPPAYSSSCTWLGAGMNNEAETGHSQKGTSYTLLRGFPGFSHVQFSLKIILGNRIRNEPYIVYQKELPQEIELYPDGSFCFQWAQRGSNPRPPACEADALPAELYSHAIFRSSLRPERRHYTPFSGKCKSLF